MSPHDSTTESSFPMEVTFGQFCTSAPLLSVTQIWVCEILEKQAMLIPNIASSQTCNYKKYHIRVLFLISLLSLFSRACKLTTVGLRRLNIAILLDATCCGNVMLFLLRLRRSRRTGMGFHLNRRVIRALNYCYYSPSVVCQLLHKLQRWQRRYSPWPLRVHHRLTIKLKCLLNYCPSLDGLSRDALCLALDLSFKVPIIKC